jgi:MSHA biogenesis protein MshP
MNAAAKRSGQRGFTIVSAIFILVVLAALGAFIVSVSTSQQIGSALDVQGVRAYQSARAGRHGALYQRCATAAYTCSPAVTGSFALPAAATTLSGFTVTVTCTAHGDGGGSPTAYQIESTACNRAVCPAATPGANYVERRLGGIL